MKNGEFAEQISRMSNVVMKKDMHIDGQTDIYLYSYIG